MCTYLSSNLPRLHNELDYVRLSRNLYIDYVHLGRNLHIHYVRLGGNLYVHYVRLRPTINLTHVDYDVKIQLVSVKKPWKTKGRYKKNPHSPPGSEGWWNLNFETLTLESGEYWRLTGRPAVACGWGRENTLRSISVDITWRKMTSPNVEETWHYRAPVPPQRPTAPLLLLCPNMTWVTILIAGMQIQNFLTVV